jgi:hypothetical protein
VKQATFRHAALEGLSEIYTWTQIRNTPMLTLNRSLGYVDRDVTISVRGSLPLP